MTPIKEHTPHTASYGDFARIWNAAPDVRRRLMKELARKTEQEQLQIYHIKTEITYRIKTSNRNQIEMLKGARDKHPACYDYILTLLAIQLHDADTTKSEYISDIREARQDPASFKTSPLKGVVLSLIPLIKELKGKGATWLEVTKIVNTKKRKILSGRKISVEYLKKTYYAIKKTSP